MFYYFQSEDQAMGADLTSGDSSSRGKRLPQYIATLAGIANN